jgi:hypothetical protein
MGIDPMNKISIIIRILFAVTLFQQRVLKKVEGTTKSIGIEGDVVADTTPHAIDSIKSWRQIFENLDYEIKNFSHDFENKLRDIAESEIQKIVARP